MSGFLGSVSINGSRILGTTDGLLPRASGAGALASDTPVTLGLVNQRFRDAASALSNAFRSLKTVTTPLYRVSVVSTQARAATAVGLSARLLPVDASRSVLQTTHAINTQTSTVQRSTAAVGLDLSPGAVSTLASALALALDVTSPETASRLSSAVLGLDLTSPDAPSKLYSAIQLALDVTSPETASRLSSAALGLDLTSPDAPSKLYSAVQLALDVTSPETASVLKSSAVLALDVTSAQSASTIRSTAEINTAATSYGSNTLTFSGGGSASTSVATLTGVYTGVNTAANATSLTVKLKNNVAALNTLIATNVRFEVRDQSNTLLLSFNGNIKAGDQVSLGADIGLSISFSAGSLTNNQTASTTVSHTKTDVDPSATFNNADPNLRPRFENNAQVSAGSFTINGTTIAVNANDSINSVIARINASAAGVTASFGSDKLTIATNTNSEDDIVLAGDTSGLLSAVKLASATTTRGNIRDDQQVLAKTTQFAAVASGSFTVNGVAISVNKNTDTLSSIISRINAAAAGVTAAYDSAQDKLTLTTTTNTEDLITVGGDTSGFLTAAKLSTANTVRGNIRDDRQVLSKTSQFVGVTSGSFTVNGTTISVDRSTDTLATVLARITSSAAGVTASYDAALDKLVLTGTTNGETLITVGGDTTGFLAATHLQTSNTVRGHVREDTVALQDLGRFASVTAGSFVVDGKTIAVGLSDTIASIVSRLNASGARVTAAFDAATNTIGLTTTYATEDPISIGSDTSGFLAAAGVDAAATTPGNIRDDRQVLSKTSQFAGVTSGSFTVNGTTISVDRSTDALATVLARITSSAAGVTASYDAALDKLVLTGTTNGETLITVGGDTTGFLAATHLQTSNTVRGHVREDTVALQDLGRFASVTAGSFVVDGRTIAVDPSHDTVQSVVSAINASGARVTASYDAASDTLALQTTYASEDAVPIGDDTSGFLEAAQLDASDTVAGNIRDDRQTLAKTSQFGTVTSGTFAINGKTIALDPTTDTLASVIDAINAADAGVTAAYDSASDRIELVGTSFSEDPIAVEGDTTGFLAAARLDAANTVRGNVPDDQQVLTKTSQFGAVTTGAFEVDGIAVTVDPASDTVQSILGKIDAAGVGVTATYDADTDTVVVTPDVAGAPLVLGNDASGFLAAAKLAPGAFGTHVNANAAFDRTGLDAPFFDPGLGVRAGSFSVNGVRIDVASDDTVNTVLARIQASSAGVHAVYDDQTQTITLTATSSTDDPIVVADDTSGFLAAVKLDGTAEATSGTTPTSSFASPLDTMTEYASVHAGAVTVNGQDVAIDPASTTIRGFVAALNGVDGVSATLDESTGVIRLSSERRGGAFTLSDTSGLLAALGIARRTYRGTPGASTTVQTKTGSVTTTTASSVAGDVSSAAGLVNEAVALLARAGDATPQLQNGVESTLRDVVAGLAKLGITGISWRSEGGQSGLVVDRARLATALGTVLGTQTEVGGPTRVAIDQLTDRIAALASRRPAPTDSSSPTIATTSPTPRPVPSFTASTNAVLLHAVASARASGPQAIRSYGATSLLHATLSDAAASGGPSLLHHGLGVAGLGAGALPGAAPSAFLTSLRRWVA